MLLFWCVTPYAGRVDDESNEYVLTTGASPLADDEDRSWVRVEGGGLRQPVYVRIGWVGEELGVLGVLINNGQRINSSDIRLPLGRIVAQWAREEMPGRPDYAGARKMKDLIIAEEDWAHWNMFVADNLPAGESVAPRGRGAAPPSESDLKAFAAVYIDELRTKQRGAVSRTAERFGMHRVTAHKWIDRCREAGVLPSEGNA
jgi:hypothetical protein